MSTLLVIGNGFDLALGFHTSYANFVNAWTPNDDNHFWPFKKPDDRIFNDQSLHQYFYDYFASHTNDRNQINWIDIERELYNYVASKRGKFVSDELVEADKVSFNSLTYNLYLYFYRHEELKYKCHPPKGEDKCVIELLKALSVNSSFRKAYTFNYTDLRKKLVTFGGFKEERIPEITYIHGSIEKSTQYSPNIVLGINTDSSLPRQYAFLQKMNNVNADAKDLASDLALSDEIIFYGLSMGRIDFEYFYSFFNSVVNAPFGSPKKHITILTRGNDVINTINQNIFDMGIDVRGLKEHSYFNIIDTHEAEFDDNGHYMAFQKLLSRLQNNQ